MRMILPAFLLQGAMVIAAFAQPSSAVLSSPNGRLSITFQTYADGHPESAGGQLSYSVSFAGKRLMDRSALSLDLQGQPPLGSKVRMANLATAQGEDNYELVTGKTRFVHDRYQALRIELDEVADPRRKLIVEARAYDDALAFRYVVPEQPSLKDFRLTQERTEFRLVKDATAYALELPNYRSMYESEFVKLPLSSFSNQGGVASTILMGLPLLLDVPGTAWVAITEADLRDYAAMYLVNPSGSWTGHWLESRIAPHPEEPEICVSGALPHHTPWRVLLIADDPGRLVESNAITSLNPPTQIKDTSWIHAGKAAWDWWSGSIGADGKHAFTTENMKYYADFAARSRFPYLLIDAGWAERGDLTKMNGRVDVPEVVRYAGAKGVKVWIWTHWAQLNRQLDEVLPLFEKWGVAGIKTDFISRDDQAGIDFYYRAAEKSAQHHLMIDFHGATKPTGIDRSYPNVLGYEAVLGMEQSKAGSRDNPEHHVTLPFTRMLAGRIDYTPGGFDNVTRAEFEARMEKPMVMGTRAHQLAMYVVYEAPFQMVSDYPAAYENVPAFQFIKDVPATWDETRVLSGIPGEYIVVARRYGKEWFLGGMTNWTARTLDIPLAFLGHGQYRAEIYSDAPDSDRLPKDVEIKWTTINAGERQKMTLAPGGGYAERLIPLQP